MASEMDFLIEEIKIEPDSITSEFEFIGIEAEDILKESIKEENTFDCYEEFDNDESVADPIEPADDLVPAALADLMCTVCSKVLSSRQSLRGHLRMHTGEFFECEYCPRKFTRKTDLKYHVNKHTGEQLYKCTYCSKTYSRKCLLRDHERTHNNPIPLPSCGSKILGKSLKLPKETPSVSNQLKRTKIRIQVTAEPIESSDSSEIDDNETLECHEELPTEDRLNNRLECAQNIGISFKCKICALKSPNLKQLQEHIVCHAKKKVFRCSYCSRTTTNEMRLSKHEKIHEKLENQSKTVDVQNACQICHQQFSSKDLLEIHENTHKFKCGECEKVFDTISHHRQHMPCKKNPKQFACEMCDKTFFSQSALKLHFWVHRTVQERPYGCSKCSKKFPTPNALAAHEKIHTRTEYQPHKCEKCPKKFATIFNLNAHRKLHTGEGLFDCSFCDKKFHTKNLKHQHEKTHSEDRPFFCSYCAKRFKSDRTLEEHERIHRGIQRFECKMCDKRFTQASTLWRHNKLVHGKRKSTDETK